MSIVLEEILEIKEEKKVQKEEMEYPTKKAFINELYANGYHPYRRTVGRKK